MLAIRNAEGISLAEVFDSLHAVNVKLKLQIDLILRNLEATA